MPVFHVDPLGGARGCYVNICRPPTPDKNMAPKQKKKKKAQHKLTEEAEDELTAIEAIYGADFTRNQDEPTSFSLVVQPHPGEVVYGEM